MWPNWSNIYFMLGEWKEIFFINDMMNKWVKSILFSYLQQAWLWIFYVTRNKDIFGNSLFNQYISCVLYIFNLVMAKSIKHLMHNTNNGVLTMRDNWWWMTNDSFLYEVLNQTGLNEFDHIRYKMYICTLCLVDII